MAEKQATVYVVDLGSTMKRKRHGRSETDLEYSLTYVWDRITATVWPLIYNSTAWVELMDLHRWQMEERLTSSGWWGSGLMARTDNTMAENEGYENISILAPIGQFLTETMRGLKRDLVPSSTVQGDGISAICIAIDMIMRYCKKLKYIRNIVLVTDGRGSFDAEGVEDICRQIKEERINLTIIGVDFDDGEYGFEEENKDPHKAENEKILNKLCEDCALGDEQLGILGTLAEAIYELGKPRLKKVRPVASFRGELTIGDPTTYDRALSIGVERYPRTAIAKPISASSYTMKTEKGDAAYVAPVAAPGGSDLQAVKNARAYQVEEEGAAGGMMDIDKEQMEKGYSYGRTVVPISSTDEAITVLETEPGLQIVGFVPAESYKRYFSMSTTNIIIGQKENAKAAMALSSLIHALFELESYALARLVTKKNAAPVLVLLAPSIDADYECLIDVQVPFAEDVRHYKFPPLDKVRSISGKVLDNHRFIPTKDMEKLVGDFVDQMDLMTADGDESGEPSEYVTVDETFSPVLHRIDQVVRWRAVHPDEDLPPVHEVLVKYEQPESKMMEAAKETLASLVEACGVKVVDAKAAGRKRGREQPMPKSGLNVEELLAKSSSAAQEAAPKKLKITSTNPIPDFKNKLRTTEDLGGLQEAGGEMLEVLKGLIKYSLADTNYGKVCEILKVMREEYLEYDEPGVYNDILRSLKQSIMGEELDGDRTDCWREIRYNKLGLVTTTESERVKVNGDEAKAFLWE